MNENMAMDVPEGNIVGIRQTPSALNVRFYIRPDFNAFQSKKEGRKIFEDKVFVRIETPGDTRNIIDTYARPDHFDRFPVEYARFKNTQGKDPALVGTPIEQWSILGPSQVEMLKALNFRTVEMIAFASDAQIMEIGLAGGMAPFSFRNVAKAFLGNAKEAAQQSELATQLAASDARNKALEERLARLEAGMAAPATVVTVQPAEPAKELKAGTPEADEVMERSQLAMTYEVKFGKKADGRWSLDKLRSAVNAESESL